MILHLTNELIFVNVWIFYCEYSLFSLLFLQKKMDWMTEYIKQLKLCVRGLFKEKDQFQSALESAEKKCTETGEVFFS